MTEFYYIDCLKCKRKTIHALKQGWLICMVDKKSKVEFKEVQEK